MWVSPKMTGSRSGMEPPWLAMASSTPCQARKKARVTTNDGMPTTVTRNPVNTPIATPTATAISTVTHQGMPCLSISWAEIDAPTPPITPADRSISPSSSTKPTPMASTVIDAAWVSRLAKLLALVNVSHFSAAKTMTSTTRPATAGRAPRSPPRMRRTYAW